MRAHRGPSLKVDMGAFELLKNLHSAFEDNLPLSQLIIIEASISGPVFDNGPQRGAVEEAQMLF